MSHGKDIHIGAEHHDERIDVVLAKCLPEYSRSLLSTWIKEGHVLLNGRSVKPKDKVHSSDTIHFNVLPESLAFHALPDEPQDIPLDVRYEDDDVLIINKPAGLVVHPGAGNPNHTLVNALLHYHSNLDQLPRAGIVHRLDKDTTGLMLVAKRAKAYTLLVKQMQERRIHRSYITLVEGTVADDGLIDTCFGRHPRNRLKMAVTPSGRQAITEYAVLHHYTHFTLLEVTLHTGRTHQIRVHMAHLQHPVVGDALYGKKWAHSGRLSPTLFETIRTFERQALHAKRLELTHPISLSPLTCEAPLPDDFQHLISQLDSHDELHHA